MNCGYRIFKCLFHLNLKTSDSAKTIYSCLLEHTRWYSKSRFKLVTKQIEKHKLKTMKLESFQFKSCLTEEVMIIKDLLASQGHEIRIVGGAVRDLLLGIQPEDLDFATTATPNEMKKVFTENNVRLINANGERHGTITTRVNEKNFEITTLRVDICTDGRHAEVQFTKDWLLDANRRDLTINAMYLGFDGTVYDYFNGYEDLKNRRVVFVGNAVERIQEDYLRILRYFRFYGKVAKTPDNHDEDVLKAITENAQGLEVISGERILVELNKILSGRFAGELLQKIVSLDIGPYIGFPKNSNKSELKAVCDRLKLKDLTVKPMTLLASLFNSEDDLTNFFMRIKPSCVERDLALFILNNRQDVIHPSPIKLYQTLILQKKGNVATKRSTVYELLKYKGKTDYIKELDAWNPPTFPVNGHMLKNKGVSGKTLGIVMNKLRDIWIENEFSLTAEKLLEQIPDDLLPSPTAQKKQRKQ